MEFATGALGALLPKLTELLQGEYQLQKNVRKNIEFLKKELETTQAALRIVGEVPPEQLNELVKIWARDARELSYDMEDVVDTFLLCFEGPDPPSKRSSKRFIQTMKSMLSVGKRHEIGEQIKDIKERMVEVAARRDRNKVDIVNHVTSVVDPRIKALYVKMTELVGIDQAKEEIIMKLTKQDDKSTQQQKMLSIVGFGGLGKTTLAKAVYEQIKGQFDCTAFVTVSRNPDMRKFFKDMLYELDKEKHRDIHRTSLDVNHLINLVREFISNKRYFIIIDDIWDISNWEIIKCALPDDNSGCIIISTTRKVKVATYIGGLYEMKPLSLDSSRVLLYRRIFNNEDEEKCLNEELTEISNRILKKCAGVPLAIITIAGLLASIGRNKTQWEDVHNSIGNGMGNSLDENNMRMILSYSYYDLPSHLRTCLLYLSMFPEDFVIEKHRLIWLWIAEGFIQHKEQGKSLFEVGEGYFNELINRSVIQSIYNYIDIEIYGCRVHDMVLDLIRSLSNKENFISVLSDTDQTYAPTMAVRRLALQHGNMDHGCTWSPRSMPHIRSVVALSNIDRIPALQSFKVLRVLDVDGCDLSNGYNLKYLGDLSHLRYLSLRNTTIDHLPEEIGKLKLLQTLDVKDSRISRLPLTVGKLKHLKCLSISWGITVEDVLGTLMSLEELRWLSIDWKLGHIVETLGLLTELRVLHVALFTNKLNAKLAESLSKLQKIQYLLIRDFNDDRHNMDGLDAWVVPPHLRTLDIRDWSWFSMLPAWINPSRLPDGLYHLLDLCHLKIAVRELRQEDLLILGRLPSLSDLYLEVDHVNIGIIRRFVIGAGSFPCLLHCVFNGFVLPVVFQPGAMPRLTKLVLGRLHVWEAREIVGCDGCFSFWLGNLLSLQTIEVYFETRGSSEEEVEEAKAAVRKEAQIHPNRPTVCTN